MVKNAWPNVAVVPSVTASTPASFNNDPPKALEPKDANIEELAVLVKALDNIPTLINKDGILDNNEFIFSPAVISESAIVSNPVLRVFITEDKLKATLAKLVIFYAVEIVLSPISFILAFSASVAVSKAITFSLA